LNSSKPFSNPSHDDCVSQEYCPNGTWANASSANCEPCSPYFAMENHSFCVETKALCGNGSSVLDGYQCQNCQGLNSSKPFSSPNHDACVKQDSCQSET